MRTQFIALAMSVLVCATCGTADLDTSTTEGREGIIDAVKINLTSEQCATAIDLIEILYGSSFTTNEVRLLRAAAHGCKAGINYFELVTLLSQTSFVNGGLWKSLTGNFPSSIDDGKSESGWFATDSLMATINSGVVIPEIYRVDEEPGDDNFNFGSVIAEDRTNNANSYLIFVAMSVIGTAHNRYGDPNTDNEKQSDLPWTSYADVDEIGCAYAGSVVNMLDGIGELREIVTGNLATAFNTIYETYNLAISTACSFGCAGFDLTGVPGVDASCTFDVSECSTCPFELRNRSMCIADDKARCAASGIVRFINDDPTGNGWPDAS